MKDWKFNFRSNLASTLFVGFRLFPPAWLSPADLSAELLSRVSPTLVCDLTFSIGVICFLIKPWLLILIAVELEVLTPFSRSVALQTLTHHQCEHFADFQIYAWNRYSFSLRRVFWLRWPAGLWPCREPHQQGAILHHEINWQRFVSPVMSKIAVPLSGSWLDAHLNLTNSVISLMHK